MKKKIKRYETLLLALLMGYVCVACSDNVLNNETSTPTGKAGSITFSLTGLNAGITTRSETASTKDTVSVSLSKYAVKLFVFKRPASSTEGGWDGYELEREPLSIESSFVTIDKIQEKDDYFYVFLAAPIAFEGALVLKTGMTNPIDPKVSSGTPGTGTDPRHCYVPVFDETAYDGDAFSFIENLTAKIGTTAPGDDFMIYGWSLPLPGEVAFDKVYTPQNVLLTPQMGAIEFDPGSVGEITSCSVYSNFYRFYLSQMTGNASTTINEIPEGEIGGVSSDLMGNYWYPKNIDKTFPAGTTRYKVFVPCSTLKGVSNEEIPEKEKANALEGTAGAEDPDLKAVTTITINEKEYKTTTSFPVFPRTTTVLKVNDGSLTLVGFKGTSGGGIDLEDDNWDGIQ